MWLAICYTSLTMFCKAISEKEKDRNRIKGKMMVDLSTGNNLDLEEAVS